MSLFQKFDDILEKGSYFFLIVCVVGLLFFSFLSIFLRWFNESLYRIDPLVRHLVFISAFLGGSLATRKKTHIGIDIISKYLEQNKKTHLKDLFSMVISLISIGTLFWLILTASDLIKTEIEFGKSVFLGIHSSVLLMIMPIGFGLILLRFIFQFIQSAKGVLNRSS